MAEEDLREDKMFWPALWLEDPFLMVTKVTPLLGWSKWHAFSPPNVRTIGDGPPQDGKESPW